MSNFISHLRLRNIKTFVDAEFDLAPLTLLTGQNGLGKSTLIQALLLLRQSYNASLSDLSKLILNGNFIDAGQGQDLYAIEAEETDIIDGHQFLSIDLELMIGNEQQKEEISGEVQFSFAYDDREANVLNRIAVSGSDAEQQLFDENALFNEGHFQYISADRIVPTEAKEGVFSKDDITNKNLGKRGQFTVGYIARKSNEAIGITALRHDNAPTDGLLDNLDAWMQKLSPTIHIKAQIVQSTAILRFTFDTDNGETDEFLPIHVGFGLTNILPVLTAILIAEPDDLIIIENPEAHLHPAAQALIGEMCAIAAENGVQFILETHSDHVLNGVRVAAKQEKIKPENIAVYFFERVEGSLITDPVRVWIDENGRMDNRPINFFDETNRQLTELIKP